MMKFNRICRAMVCAAALVLWSVPATVWAQASATLEATAEHAWTPVENTWMIMEIGGSKVGWLNTVVEQSGDLFRTSAKTQMKMERGPTKVEIEMESIFLENSSGEPVQVKYVQKMGKQPMRTTWDFDGENVTQTSSVGGRETTSQVKRPAGEWMTPRKGEEFVRAQQEAGAEKITYRTLNPENGLKLITITSTSAGDSEFEFNGTKQPVTVWKTVNDLMPIEATEYYDKTGEMVFQEVPTGLGKIVMRRATKEQALEEGAGGAPEVMVKSFIKPNKPIERSMKTRTAKLKLTAKEGQLPDIPSAGAQRVEMAQDRKSAVLVIDVDENLDASAADVSNEEFTRPSSMVDFEDALVMKIGEGAKDEASAMAKALALRTIAHDRISKKGMATAFACASETARTRTGDCSEHGVLLCALLRSQGIPARVAMGLVYVDQFMGEEGIFGWHMWTQALIDGKWVDLDATLPVPYNASHVLTNVSSLSDGLGAADMASILQMIGNVDIDVVEVGYD